MNHQVKSKLSAVREFFSGRSDEPEVEADDNVERVRILPETAAVSSELDNEGDNPIHASGETNKMYQADDNQGIEETREPHPAENKGAPQQLLNESYFEDTVESLRPGHSSAERAAAARALGLLGSQRATPHLIAAMFDDEAEVRSAAEDALSQINNPKAAGVESEPAVQAKAPTEDLSTVTVSSIEPTENLPAEPSVPVVEAETASTIDDQKVERAPETTSVFATEAAAIETEITAPLFAEVPEAIAELPAGDELNAAETAIKERLSAVEQEIAVVVSAVKEAENEIHWRVERENQLRAEADARRVEEEELRKRAAEEAHARRAQEHEALIAEQEARLKTEAEIQRQTAAEKDRRLQFAAIRGELFDLVRRRAELGIARQEAAEATERDLANRLRVQAQAIHQGELETVRTEEGNLKRTAEELRQQQEQLRVDIENLNEANLQIARQRGEVQAAREKADAENEEFAQAQLRMRTAERARAKAETERSQLEADLNRQLATHERELEDTRLRYQQEQERLQEELRLQAAKEKAHYEELQAMRARAEEESQRLADAEKEILGDVDSLRIKDLDTRRRIADAEAKHRATEEAYRLIAEKVQRVEAEAHASAHEEEQMLLKLEAERRRVAMEAQSRAEQEKRIREEIEVFRRLEAEERPRIEAATLQLADAEKRLGEQKARLEGIAEAGVQAAEDLKIPVRASFDREAGPLHAAAAIGADDIPTGVPAVSPTISTFLNSVDPYKRAAAVAELARANSTDAFKRITDCFDDPSPHVRNAAARALRKLEPERTVDLFNRALDEASPDRKRHIGAAIAGSGLAAEAVNNLGGENPDDTFTALSILFVMAKTGEVAPLITALDAHRQDEIGKAVTKLLMLSGHHSGPSAVQDCVAKASGGSESAPG